MDRACRAGLPRPLRARRRHRAPVSPVSEAGRRCCACMESIQPRYSGGSAETASRAARSSAPRETSVAPVVSANWSPRIAPWMTLVTASWCSRQASASRATLQPLATVIRRMASVTSWERARSMGGTSNLIQRPSSASRSRSNLPQKKPPASGRQTISPTPSDSRIGAISRRRSRPASVSIALSHPKSAWRARCRAACRPGYRRSAAARGPPSAAWSRMCINSGSGRRLRHRRPRSLSRRPRLVPLPATGRASGRRRQNGDGLAKACSAPPSGWRSASPAACSIRRGSGVSGA